MKKIVSVNKIKTIAFAVVFCLLYSGASWLFKPATDGTSIIYYEPANTIDVLFVGSSHFYRGINPNVIWREEGVAGFVYGSNNQPAWTSYYYIREALKTQKPSLIVLDLVSIYDRVENGYRQNQQNIFTAFSPSFNKLGLLNAGIRKEERAYMFLALPFFHTRWRDIAEDSLPYTKRDYMITNEKRYKGIGLDHFLNKADLPLKLNEAVYPTTNEVMPVPEKNLYYLLKIIELSKEKGFTLLFLDTPSSTSIGNKDREMICNMVRQIAEQNQIRYIGYNDNEYRDAIGFDFTSDLFDTGHLNTYGASKVSKHLAALLKADYGLPDRRGNPKYKSWDEAAAGYFLHEDMEYAKTKSDFPSYLNAIRDANRNLIFVISVKGGIGTNFESVAEVLSQVTTVNTVASGGYICIYEPSSGYVYEDMSSAKMIRKNIYKEGLPVNIEVVSAGSNSGNLASIKIDGVEQAKNQRGLNIVIYDKQLDMLFDSFYVDTAEDDTFTIKR